MNKHSKLETVIINALRERPMAVGYLLENQGVVAELTKAYDLNYSDLFRRGSRLISNSLQALKKKKLIEFQCCNDWPVGRWVYIGDQK